MGIAEDYDTLLAQENLRTQDLDRIVLEVLSTMHELKIV